MKTNSIFRIIIIYVFFTYNLNAQITVSSLLELKPFLDDDNVDVTLEPGDYYLDANDITNGDWGEDIPFMDWAKGIIIFEGNDSSYDFTGVTIYFDTNIFKAFGNFDVWELEVRGNNNILKNLTMVDKGSVYDAPTKGATNVHVDGQYNVIDGFHVTGKGSSPYAWGDSFGKGSGSILSLQKHSAVNLRGDYNTVKNTTIIHRAFGHCLVMQAANTPTIEGCYIEGEMRSTDDMLADPNIISPPITTWGYRLPSGYMKALCEEGIRSYNRGETLINGEYVERGTNDITVKNTTVKNARGGCSIVLSSGFRHVENVTLLGCEFGFSVGDAELINCSADAVYGPAYMNAYDDKRNTVSGDLTILPPSAPYYNGSGLAAFFGGKNSNITIHNSEGAVGEGLVIKIGGETNNIGQIGDQGHTATDNIINNETNYPVVVDAGSSGNTINSCADVDDNGSGNLVSTAAGCKDKNCHLYETQKDILGLVSGLNYYYFEGVWNEFPNFNFETPVSSGTTPTIDLGNTQVESNYGFRYFGYVNFPEEDTYTFSATATDGALLYIDGVLVADSRNADISMEKTEMCLKAGLHQFRLDFYDRTGDKNIVLMYEADNITEQELDEFYYQSSPENIALQGIATQSTTGYGGSAEKAIDGNIDGNFGNGSVTHTEHGETGSSIEKWWQVDLQSEFFIESINIYNRTGKTSYSDKLNNFKVEIIDANDNITFAETYVDYPNPSVTIETDNVKGKVVKISKTSDYAISLAEVQVFGVGSVLSTNDFKTEEDIDLYPVPVIDVLNITNCLSADFEIFNSFGELLLTGIIGSDLEKMDISNLTAGVYVLRIRKNNLITERKFLKI